MVDARLRILPPLLLAAAALAVAGCASQTAAIPAALPAEQVENVPAEADDPALPESAATTPEELEALAPEVAPLAPAVAYGDVIVRIRSKLTLPQVSHPRVDREIEWLQRNPDYLARVFGRAQRYLHHVANEVEFRGLPGDLALRALDGSVVPVLPLPSGGSELKSHWVSGVWAWAPPAGACPSPSGWRCG